MSHLKNPEKVESGQRKVETVDRNTEKVLLYILKELQKINLHLSLITNEFIINKDVE